MLSIRHIQAGVNGYELEFSPPPTFDGSAPNRATAEIAFGKAIRDSSATFAQAGTGHLFQISGTTPT